MPDQLSALESSRSSLLRQISQLHDMRPGSVSTVFRRCGKPSCHCAQPKDQGHGPHFQITSKIDGKTVTQMLSSLAAVNKAEQEIAEFRNFEKLSQSLIEVNRKVCELRPVENADTPWTSEEKKRLMQSIRKLHAR
jgi:hypothetical protein